jgi:hypothetical protein
MKNLKVFQSVEEADDYLCDLAVDIGLSNWMCFEDIDEDGQNIMTLVEEDFDNIPIKNHETVIFLGW